MSRSLRVMLVGESWFTYSIHQKGFDTFQTSEYTEGADAFIAGVEHLGHHIQYIPAHRVDADFPAHAGDFATTDVVVLSDVGANTFLLTKKTFSQSEVAPNRLEALRAYVGAGGALLMIGGYMSFAGIDGKARYGHSPLADVLPVRVQDHDDRVEVPEGFNVTVVDAAHPALAGVPSSWPPCSAKIESRQPRVVQSSLRAATIQSSWSGRSTRVVPPHLRRISPHIGHRRSSSNGCPTRICGTPRCGGSPVGPKPEPSFQRCDGNAGVGRGRAHRGASVPSPDGPGFSLSSDRRARWPPNPSPTGPTPPASPGIQHPDQRITPHVPIQFASLATCQEITYRLHADHLGIPLDGVAVTIEGDLDLRGFFGVGHAVRPGFTAGRGRAASGSRACSRPSPITRASTLDS